MRNLQKLALSFSYNYYTLVFTIMTLKPWNIWIPVIDTYNLTTQSIIFGPATSESHVSLLDTENTRP